MREAGYDRMVFISSIKARITRPGANAYTTAKARPEGLMHSLAIELGTQGITLGNFLTDGNAPLHRERTEFQGRISECTALG